MRAPGAVDSLLSIASVEAIVAKCMNLLRKKVLPDLQVIICEFAKLKASIGNMYEREPDSPLGGRNDSPRRGRGSSLFWGTFDEEHAEAFWLKQVSTHG